MPIIKATKSNIEKCAKLIKKGDVVAFPTETVYGLGGCAFNEKAIKKIFKLKQRPYNDPLIVHISSYKQLNEIAYIDKKILNFLKKIWPSPLTIILPKKDVVPDIVTSKLNTIAVRYPQNKIALSLIKLSKTPIAAPSANKFSRLSPTTAEHVFKYFPTIPILDGGKTVHGIESTVIKIENDILYILRYGAVTVEKLKKIWKGKIKKYNNKNKKLSPGMLKKHYSPIKKLFIVNSQKEIQKPDKSAFISFGEKAINKYAFFIDLSPNKNLDEASRNLFDYLHKADENKNVEVIYIKKIPLREKGIAIMERLKKASFI